MPERCHLEKRFSVTLSTTDAYNREALCISPYFDAGTMLYMVPVFQKVIDK
jgi:hypothetical protein